VATRLFSESELARWRGFPEIACDELIRFFTLSNADLTFVRSHRGDANRLGLAVQLCVLPWLGFVPDDLVAAPAAGVARLAARLDVPTGGLASYGRRGQTRSDHLRAVAGYLGWRPVGEREFKDLDAFLLARAGSRGAPRRMGCWRPWRCYAS